jgi:hypothetical protein
MTGQHEDSARMTLIGTLGYGAAAIAFALLRS